MPRPVQPLGTYGEITVRLSETRSAPAVDAAAVGRILTAAASRRHGARGRRGSMVSTDQRAAIATVATSGRWVEVLVGPAGTGKTTTMQALRTVWERQFGRGSIVGLAPSAAAAQVLAEELGVRTENTAKWLHEHRRGRWRLGPCQLVVVDEASLAATADLDTLATHAARVGAKVLLTGDPHQLDAVDAGGAFHLLVSRRREAGDVAELTEVRRFTHQWEKHASLRLRRGEVEAIDAYAGHDRIRDGEQDDMVEAAYQAWRQDVADGRRSVMIAEARDTVTELNRRARADRLRAGNVTPDRETTLRDGTHASAGDVIVTRRNDRRLMVGRGWVKNGDTWHVTQTHPDGSLTAHRTGGRPRGGGGSVRLPAAYVAEYVELGYATTVHRAQGATVDTAHVLVTPQMTREAYYVAMTRARNTNTCYVATDHPGAEAHQTPPEDAVTARQVLSGVLHHVGAETSAHQSAEAERDRWGSIGQLAAEYETLAGHAQQHRWNQALDRSGLSSEQVGQAVASDAYGPLTALLRRIEADGHNTDTLLRAVVAQHGLDGVDDVAAVLHHRLRTATSEPDDTRPGTRVRPRRCMIAGLIPEAAGPMPDHLRDALDRRAKLIEERAGRLVDHANRDNAAWLRALGNPPADPVRQAAWLRQVRVIAAYRDRHHITTDQPLGPAPETRLQKADHARAADAYRRARQQTRTDAEHRLGPTRSSPTRPPGPTL